MSDDSEAPVVSEEHQALLPPPPQPNKSRLHGLAVAPAAAGFMTVLCGSVPMLARLPDAATAPAPILPGMWVNFEMDLLSGENQIVCECEPRYRTYLFDDGTFSVLSPATYYIEEDMDEEYDRVAYTPYFRFVDDPDGHLQDIDWMEWYEVLLTGSGGGAYLLKVERIVRGMAGCVEPGSLPGQMPTRAQIEAAIKADIKENDYKGVKEVNSCQLGLCIGHVGYVRTPLNEGGDKMSAYGSGRGSSFSNRGGGRGGGYNGGRGGERGGYGTNSGGWRGSNFRGGGAWREQRNSEDGMQNGNWRLAAQREKQAGGSMQHQRTDDPDKKKVAAAIIFSPRGIVASKLESESYNEGQWLTFDKMCKTEYTCANEKAGRPSYLPYILQHRPMPGGYGGRTRVKGPPGAWGVQVLVQAEYGWLRAKQWCDPSFFGMIKCADMWQRKATKMLTEQKMGWAEMSEEKRDTVVVNVWVGMDVEMTKMQGMDAFPSKAEWEVKDLPEEEFIHDLPLDKARAAGALPTICMHNGQEDEEAIVQEMCTSLLARLIGSSRAFERHWTTTVAEALERNQQGPAADANHRDCLGPQQLQLLQQSAAAEAASELAAVVEETVGVFERSVSLALLHTEPGTPNRDATAIFDARRIVGRTVEREGGASEEQVVVALRRLTRLARTLGGRLTSPYHVANSSVLAAAVCEMGFQLEEQLKRGEGKRLRRALDEMNERVVEGMRELLVSTRPIVPPATVTTPHRSASAPVRKPVPPRRTTVPGGKRGGYGSRSPGFLLSTGMREARSKLPPMAAVESRYRGKSRERRREDVEGGEGGGGEGGGRGGGRREEDGGGAGRNRFVIKPDPHCRHGREVAALEQKWGRMLEGEAAFLRSALRQEKSREGAERLARDITREVLEELDARKRKVL